MVERWLKVSETTISEEIASTRYLKAYISVESSRVSGGSWMDWIVFPPGQLMFLVILIF